VSADWNFLFAWASLLAVVVAPARAALVLLGAPGVVEGVVVLALVAASFAAADWFDREGAARLDVPPGGPATFVALQFVVAPTVALVLAPPDGATPPSLLAALERPASDAPTEAWAAFVPALRPRVVRPTWLAVTLAALPFSTWVGLLDGARRVGLRTDRTVVFAIALVVALGTVTLLAPLVDTTPSVDGRGFWLVVLACELAAATVAYGLLDALPRPRWDS
jgi:hypothetical protein